MTPKGWIALSLSQDLEPGTVAGAMVEGKEVVLWRGHSGAAHVWDDRCRHRGMRLSFGFVKADHLGCLYHGWRYDGGGRCRAIPAHPNLDVPDNIYVRAYPVAESCGLVWAWFSSGNPGPLPVEAAAVTPLRSLYLDVPLETAYAALAAATISGFAVSPPGRIALPAELAEARVLAAGNDRLLVAGQSIDGGHSALHIVILGAAQIYGGAGQHHFAAWAEAFRSRVESAFHLDEAV